MKIFKQLIFFIEKISIRIDESKILLNISLLLLVFICLSIILDNITIKVKILNDTATKSSIDVRAKRL